MSMVEPNNCLDMIANGIPEDEEFDNILNILDFPMESLEDDAFVSDWDISKSHCLGPIPTNVLMGNSTIPDVKAKNGPTYLSNELVVPIFGAEDLKRPSNLVSASGPPHTVRSNESVEAQESSVFQTQSPVSVLESSGSCSATKNTVPMRARSKRLKGTGPNPWLSASSYFITKRSSLPRKDKDTNKKKKKKSSVEVEGSGLAPNHPGPQTHRPAVAKRCMHCEVTKTPQWREGPLGPKTLCNACGVRYRSGRLFPEYRPAASPTFVPTHHSNSHKKVIEMRNKGKETEQKANDEPLVSSPPPEFVPMNKYDTCVSDRDISKSHCLGPIPSDVLMSPPTIPDRKVETGPTYLSNELVVPIVEAQDQNQPSNLVAATGPRALQSNESIEAQELSVFQTQSPVSVLDSSGPSSAPKNVPNTIPVQARPKRLKGTGPNPWLSSYLTKRISLPGEDKDTKNKKKKSSDGVENYPGPQIHHPSVARKCTHCEVTETPQWREGPLGPKTLCNACGMRYRSGRLLPEYRPAVSPTFVSARHSNSHKKVIEMRNTRRSSPPPEFVPMSNYLFDYIY